MFLTNKPQQAAASMKVMSLESPNKTAKSPALVFEQEEAEDAPEVDQVEDLRTRFVGDIEITEGMSIPHTYIFGTSLNYP